MKHGADCCCTLCNEGRVPPRNPGWCSHSDVRTVGGSWCADCGQMQLQMERLVPRYLERLAQLERAATDFISVYRSAGSTLSERMTALGALQTLVGTKD